MVFYYHMRYNCFWKGKWQYCLYDFPLFETQRYIGVWFPLEIFIDWVLGTDIYIKIWFQRDVIKKIELYYKDLLLLLDLLEEYGKTKNHR